MNNAEQLTLYVVEGDRPLRSAVSLHEYEIASAPLNQGIRHRLGLNNLKQ